jgi:hypothetical protein
MDRKKLLLIAATSIAVSLIPFAPLSAVAESTGCSRVEFLNGECPEVQAHVTDDGVDVSATHRAPGNNTGSGQPGTGASGTGQPAPPPGPLPGTPEYEFLHRNDGWTVTSPVTLADLVNFKPSPGVDRMEPNGWMIVGLDTNFYAVVGSQVKTGVLLGQQASVRFTPVHYHWTYGDGYGARLASKGGTWASQGVHEFDRTPTSHVYAKAGTYYIDLSIDFSAEYRYAGGEWIPVAGTINVPANRLMATAGAAKTVLVERDCTVPPLGPGC